LEAKLDLPPKMPDKSSTPPSPIASSSGAPMPEPSKGGWVITFEAVNRAARRRSICKKTSPQHAHFIGGVTPAQKLKMVA
jgi:cell division septation protein DedD